MIEINKYGNKSIQIKKDGKTRTYDAVFRIRCDEGNIILSSSESNFFSKDLTIPYTKLLINGDSPTSALEAYSKLGEFVGSAFKSGGGTPSPTPASDVAVTHAPVNYTVGEQTAESHIAGIDAELGNLNTEVNEAQTLASDAIDRVKALEGGVVYLTAYDFGSATPTQQDLTDYALSQPHITELFDGLSVVNTNDEHEWRYQAIPATNPVEYEWVDIGISTVSTATNANPGIVKGSISLLKVSVDVNGEMSVNGLQNQLNSKLYVAPNGIENLITTESKIDSSYLYPAGDNLIKNSLFTPFAGGMTYADLAYRNVADFDGGLNALSTNRITTGVDGIATMNNIVKVSGVYTFSLFAKLQAQGDPLRNTITLQIGDTSKEFQVTTNWQLYSVTGYVDVNSNNIAQIILKALNAGGAGNVYAFYKPCIPGSWSINPEDLKDICEINYLTKTTWVQGSINASTGTVQPDNYRIVSDFIAIRANEVIYAARYPDWDIAIHWYDENKVWISGGVYVNWIGTGTHNGNLSLQYPNYPNARFMRVILCRSSNALINISEIGDIRALVKPAYAPNGSTPLINSSNKINNTYLDYEEGVWAPNVYGLTNAGTISWNTRYGKYIRTGSKCYIEGFVSGTFSSSDKPAGIIAIGGLPYANKGEFMSSFCKPNNFNYTNQDALLFLSIDTNYARIGKIVFNGANSTLDNAVFGTDHSDINFNINFRFEYIIK